jgi:hypothetical protein
MSEPVQLALISAIATVAVALISNWDKIFKSRGRGQVQAKKPFRFGSAVMGGLLAAVLTYSYQQFAVEPVVEPAGEPPLPADLMARCDYKFAEPRPPRSMSNKINDGLLWYSSTVACDRLDPRHRQERFSTTTLSAAVKSVATVVATTQSFSTCLRTIQVFGGTRSSTGQESKTA